MTPPIDRAGMHNRRTFLRTSALAVTAAAVTRPPALPAAAAGREAGGPTLTLIDTHTHFYDPARPQGVPWPRIDDAFLYRTVLPKDYRALPVPHPVTGTVVVEASPWVDDNQWVLDLAGRDPFIVGLVGHLKPGEDGFRANLNRFAVNPLFRAIRIQSGTLRAGLAGRRFVADLNDLAARNLALDVNGPAAGLPEVARLAEAAPGLRIVINHLGNIRIDGKTVSEEWRRDMAAAAKHPRVFAKVSGLVEGAARAGGPPPAEVDFYAPYLNVMWEAFGADRLIYGSNWPVSERFASLAQVQGLVTAYFTPKGPETLAKVFAGNAATAYRWVRREQAAPAQKR